MILTPIRRYGAMILMLLTLVFSSEVLAKTHTTTASQKSHLTKASNKQVSSKQEYSRNSAKSSSLPDFAKIPFRNTKEKGVSPDRNALHYQPKCGHYCGT